MNLRQASSWLETLSAHVRQFHLPRINIQPFIASNHRAGASHSLVAFIIALASTFCGMCLALTIFQFRQRKNSLQELERVRELMVEVKMTARLEDNLNKMLFMVGKIIPVPYNAFYVWDARSDQFILRSVSHPYDLFEGVGPAYSGLALPKREAYLPPRVIEVPQEKDTVFMTKDGDASVLVLRIGEQKGLIRMGPVDQVSRRNLKQLLTVSELFGSVLDDFMDFEMYRVESAVKAMADSAINKVASLATNTYATVEIMLHAFVGMTGSMGAAVIESRRRGRVRIHADDTSQVWASVLEHEGHSDFNMKNLMGLAEQHLLIRNDPKFYELPESITSLEEVGSVVLRRLSNYGLLVLLYRSSFTREHYLSTGLRQIRFIADQLLQVLNQAKEQQGLAKSHVRVLTKIAEMLNNLNPYTVGYSAMMVRYSLVIGKELGLSEKELHDLALAAQLSNVGIIGMDMGLLFKEGKYTDYEYNLMKHHCEIGASMIETVTGNRQAASFVLYHHERVDGTGYPHGISGAGIPIGAKILNVVQVFLAKINGRSWRTPLPFESAIEELQRSAGASLDPEVVAAFISWLERKGKEPERDGLSLGACHEMCCVPRSICESCPAYNQPVRCWEVPNNHCRAHGRECETCFVRTEFLNRTQKAL